MTVSSTAATVPSWVALVAGVGVGTMIAALVTAWTSKAVAIAGHRQAWINALRDHLSDYFHKVEALRAARARFDTGRDRAVSEVLADATKEYRQILMRLNAHEKPHQELAKALKALLDEAPGQQVDEVLEAARAVLKREWEVTKGFSLKRLFRRRAARKASGAPPKLSTDGETSSSAVSSVVARRPVSRSGE